MLIDPAWLIAGVASIIGVLLAHIPEWRGDTLWVSLIGLGLLGALMLIACHILKIAWRIIGQQRAVLYASEDRYRLITERSADLIALATSDGRIHYASPSFQSVLGFDPAVVVGKLAFQHVHPADTTEITAHFARICASGVDQAAFRLRHADGTWRWIETRGARTIDSDHAALVIVGRDITERKRREADLLHLQKLDSFGYLAGTVVHDLNNLLTGIGGVASLGLHALPPGHAVQSDLEAIGLAASRASTLARQLLALAHRPDFAPRTLDLNDLIRSLAHLLQRMLGADIDYRMALAPDLKPVRGDPAQLEQAILNLAMNARDAMPSGGKLTIESSNIVLETSAEDIQANQAGREHVRLVVSDTGIGMDKATQARIFEPFFTTKAPGHGTGLGLSTCAAIIAEHGGTLQIDSTLGRGTTVTLYLPCVVGYAGETAPATK